MCLDIYDMSHEVEEEAQYYQLLEEGVIITNGQRIFKPLGPILKGSQILNDELETS